MWYHYIWRIWGSFIFEKIVCTLWTHREHTDIEVVPILSHILNTNEEFWYHYSSFIREQDLIVYKKLLTES